jgi:Gas vesicle synthesis protein GvpL/GvpF
MPEYVYGIVAADGASPPREAGVGDAPIKLITDGDVAALVSELPTHEVRLGRAEALTHARVLEAALANGTVLPMRFGVVMHDAEEVRRRLLSEHAAELRDQLQRLAGKVEVNLRAVYDEEALMRQVIAGEPEVARLKDSLRGRSEDATYFDRIRLGELVAHGVERIREADADAIIDALTPAAVGISAAEPAHERVALNASFLIDRARLGDFDRILDQVAAQRWDRMRFKYTGPLPPHSFVELAGSV